MPVIPGPQDGGIPSPQPQGVTPQQPPTIYLIRHGEKNPEPKHPKRDPPVDPSSLIGLNSLGETRAKALPSVFNNGNTNPFDIRLILTMQPQPGGSEERPFQTIWPLAQSLQTIPNNYCTIDSSVLRDDTQEAANRISYFIKSGSAGNVLVCWEHHHLQDILTNFGFNGAPEYPDMFDVVWELRPTRDNVQSPSTWSYNSILWSSERTDADLTLANDEKAWRQQAVKGGKLPKDLTTEATGNGPSFSQWAPYSAGSDN